MLTIPEQWIILALDEDDGKIKIPHSVFQCGITAGMLLELALINRIGLIQEKKLQVLDNSPMEDPLLNKALGLMFKSKKLQTILNWIIQLTMQNSQVIESFYFKQMAQKNILIKKPHNVMEIFTSNRLVPLSNDLQSEILSSFTKMIRMNTPNEVRSLCLLGLVARSSYAEKFLGGERVALYIKSFSSISSLYKKQIPSLEFMPFFDSVLEAFILSQRSAGDFSS